MDKNLGKRGKQDNDPQPATGDSTGTSSDAAANETSKAIRDSLKAGLGEGGTIKTER